MAAIRTRRPAPIRRGFTLLEILLVIAIIVVLAGAVAFTLGGTGDRANEDNTRILLQKVDNAAQTYKLHTKQVPPSLDSLLPNNGVQGAEQAGYIKQADMVDAWGNPLQYRPAGSSYMLYSYGRNGADDGGGGDDLVAGQ